jgi:Na+/H+-dicarboxylate symporter
MYSGSLTMSPLSNSEAHSIYPQKVRSAGMKDPHTQQLRTPTENQVQLTDGLSIRDMLATGYDKAVLAPIWQVMLSAGVGIALGLLLTNLKISPDAAKWVAFPGDLFIAALNCLIVPMVFCSVVVCIGELMQAGKAASIGGRMITYFAISAITSSTTSVIVGFFFSSLFNINSSPPISDKTPVLNLACNSGALLTMQPNGLVSCSARNATESIARFTLNDTTAFFTVQSSGYARLSVSDQIFSILKSLVPDNIVNAFAQGTTLSVITFAVCFGLALSKSVDKAREGDNFPLLLISHANVLCRMIVNKVVSMIPVAIISMIAGSLAKSPTSAALLESVGFLIIALFVGLFTLTVGILGTVLFVTTRRNIFSWLRNIVPAQVFIAGCASSIATLPITLRCVESSREVSPALARFVIPLGATSNLNGAAVYIPMACIYMASVSGNEASLTPLTYIMLALVSAISSFGIAPVPHAALVMVITIWRTVFGMDLPPQAFSILVGADWILDRMRSIVNITNDTILCRIIAQQCDETVEAQLNQGNNIPVTPEAAM